MSLISVIVPTFNRDWELIRCIRSIERQNFDSVEVIIVDDGSEPAVSIHEIQTRLHCKLITIPNSGVSVARNRGLSAAQGQYVLFLDSDDELEVDALEIISSKVKEDPDIIVGCWRNREMGVQDVVHNPCRAYADEVANAALVGWITGAVAFRRELAPRVSETTMPWEMAELWLELASRADRGVAFIDQPIVNVWQNSRGSLTTVLDHFNPSTSSRFWVEMKSRFGTNEIRREAFDRRIFGYALSLYYSGDIEGASWVFSNIDRSSLKTEWVEIASPAWFCSLFGLRKGLIIRKVLVSVYRKITMI